MTTVIEVRGRGGQLLDRYRGPAADAIRIGRAFDNDLILEDRCVSPQHLTLTRTDDGWLVTDHDSLNGYERVGRHGGRRDLLRSGDRLRIGHSMLQVYDDRHPVPDALPVDDAEIKMMGLGSNGVWPLLLLASLTVFLAQSYLGSFGDFRWLPGFGTLTAALAAIGGIAAIWALLGRLLRHRATFRVHVSTWALYSVLAALAGWLASVVGYNFSSATVFAVIDNALNFLLLFGILWVSLLLATNLRRKARTMTSLGISSALLTFSLILSVGVEEEFSATPDYYGQVMQPMLLWAPAAGEDATTSAVARLVERADAEVARLAERDARQEGGRRTSASEEDRGDRGP